MAKKRLGKGLSAIFEDVEEGYRQGIDAHTDSELVKEIPVEEIMPNPYQPRKSFDQQALENLSQSIKEHGLLQPVVVVEKDDGYMLIAGERRLRATKLAGLPVIKAFVADFQSEKFRELALIENIQREDLNPIELANSYAKLIEEYGITQEELSEIIHKSRTQIANTMRLLKLTPYTQHLIEEGKISQGHAKVLVGLDPENERMIVDTVIGQKLSVRDCEELVKHLKHACVAEPDKGVKSTPKNRYSYIDKAVDILREKGLKAKKNSNNLIINLSDENELTKFLNLLKD